MSGSGRYAHLASRAFVKAVGPDAKSFLQGLLTQDVETLGDGQMRFSGLLTPQGRLIYDLFLTGEDSGVLLDVAARHRDDLIRRLTIYRLRAKLTLAADERPVVALWDVAGAPAAWIEDPRLPQLGFRGAGLEAGDAEIVDESAYERHRLEQGAPGPADWGVEASYPIEADFDLLNGIDFRKGCFVGQETTSRMKRRGQIKTRMLPITFDGPAPAQGTEVLAGDLRAGVVGAGGEGQAMATLRLDRIAGALTVDGRPARVRYPDWYPREFA